MRISPFFRSAALLGALAQPGSGGAVQQTPVHDFLAETHSKHVRPVTDRSVLPIEEARALTGEISAWMAALPENSTILFPAGRYYLTSGLLLKNHTKVLGATEHSGSGESLSVTDRTIFILHPQAPGRGSLRADKTLDALARTNSFNALLHAKRSAAERADGITVSGLTLDVGAPTPPAPLAQDLEATALASAVRLENPINCEVSGLHITNTYLGAISLVSTGAGEAIDYGHGLPCAPSPFHKVTRNQYAGTDASCHADFLHAKNNLVAYNLIENYRHALAMDAPGLRKKPFSPPHIIGIELASPVEAPGAKLQDSAARQAGYPSYNAASSIGITTIQGNSITGGEYGISMVNAVLNKVTGNRTAMCAHRGISLQRGADYNLISDNHVIGHGGSGIHIANDSDGNDIVHNLVEGSGLITDANGGLDRVAGSSIGLYDAEGDGIKVYVNSNQNKITKNIVKNCLAAGIRVGHHAIGNEVSENQVSVSPEIMAVLVDLDRRIKGKTLKERFVALPVGLRLAAVFDEQRTQTPFGAEFYPAGHPLAGQEKVQSQAELAFTRVVHNTFAGVARGIILGDDSARHPAGEGRTDEGGVRPSVHDNVITDNTISISPAALEFLQLAPNGVATDPATGFLVDGAAAIGTYSSNLSRGTGNRSLACDPTLRMRNNTVSGNQVTSPSPGAAMVNPRIR